MPRGEGLKTQPVAEEKKFNEEERVLDAQSLSEQERAIADRYRPTFNTLNAPLVGQFDTDEKRRDLYNILVNSMASYEDLNDASARRVALSLMN